jgi:hypothetical protein
MQSESASARPLGTGQSPFPSKEFPDVLRKFTQPTCGTNGGKVKTSGSRAIRQRFHVCRVTPIGRLRLVLPSGQKLGPRPPSRTTVEISRWPAASEVYKKPRLEANHVWLGYLRDDVTYFYTERRSLISRSAIASRPTVGEQVGPSHRLAGLARH